MDTNPRKALATKTEEQLRDLGEPRSYVVGLPVVISVYPDGTVTADVDLSEAHDVTDFVDEDGYEQAVTDEDIIINAVDNGAVIVLPNGQQRI